MPLGGLELSTCNGLFTVQPAANFTVYSPPGLFADVIAIEARHSPHLVEWPIPLILRGPGLAHTEPSTHTNLAYDPRKHVENCHTQCLISTSSLGYLSNSLSVSINIGLSNHFSNVNICRFFLISLLVFDALIILYLTLIVITVKQVLSACISLKFNTIILFALYYILCNVI